MADAFKMAARNQFTLSINRKSILIEEMGLKLHESKKMVDINQK